MKCDELTSLFSLYLDDEIDADGRTMIEAHLAACARCRRELARLTEAERLITDHLPVLEPAPELWAGILQGIEAVPAESSWRIGWSWRSWTLATAAGLALFGIIAAGVWYQARPVFNRGDLQLEWQNYAQQRQRVLQKGNPFRQAPAERDQAFTPSDDNPFTPYLKVRHRNPFMEAE